MKKIKNVNNPLMLPFAVTAAAGVASSSPLLLTLKFPPFNFDWNEAKQRCQRRTTVGTWKT
ncbi:hypothetical protein ERO13_D12G167350v2 [Gossypium hirsutum]|uniref:Uncharacterized protein n=1 Tax=Gossypium darwinii TaxID=34276 RepID=A0A5D2ACS1_GOSDA|nr:hypothetical protein ERO13_D12G167350v2 [Gossypium hirsutum]TYG41696.1 hypothetical protein ES288_D12G196300v1 [Gossypium darwinii]